jgi:hypothetical protein
MKKKGELNAGKDEEQKVSPEAGDAQNHLSHNTANFSCEPAELGIPDGHETHPESEARQTHHHPDLHELSSPSPPSALEPITAPTQQLRKLDAQAEPVQDNLITQDAGRFESTPGTEGVQDPRVAVQDLKLSEQELEIQWLLREEARIRERKELLQKGLQK